jgi:hypothetical protein
MPIILDGSLGITTPTYGGTDTAEYITPVVGMKNRLINGSMQIDQRNAGASVSTSSGVQIYSVDRWRTWYSSTSKISIQQNAGSVTPPSGFTNYLGITSLATTSLGAADYYFINQVIEGFNSSDFSFGTSNASTVTLSFWVRSSLTGTFGGGIQNSGGTRSYPFSYTISSANTWEQKTITIAGDTTGTWVGATNGVGVQVNFSLGVGSNRQGTANTWAASDLQSATGATSVVGTNGATFYITGVQLEKGTQATSFDYRPYGTELALCQRYYEINAYQMYASGNYASQNWQVAKRASPTVTITSGSGGTIAAMAGSPTTSYVLTAYASASNSSTITGSSEL